MRKRISFAVGGGGFAVGLKSFFSNFRRINFGQVLT